MSEKEVEKLFMELQFDDLLDILLKQNIIDEEEYNYYNKLYYSELDYKDEFLEKVVDKL